jgi:hypothetical protein
MIVQNSALITWGTVWNAGHIVKALKLQVSLNRGQRWWWCVGFLLVATVEGHAQPRGESRASEAAAELSIRPPAQPNIVHGSASVSHTRGGKHSSHGRASIISHSIQAVDNPSTETPPPHFVYQTSSGNATRQIRQPSKVDLTFTPPPA